MGKGEKVEVFEEDKVLCIVSARPKVQVILHNLDQIFKNVHKEVLRAGLAPAGSIEKMELEEAGRIATAIVKMERKTRKVSIWNCMSGCVQLVRQSADTRSDICHLD